MGPAPTITNVDSPPLHALRNSNGVVNGVYSVLQQQHLPDQLRPTPRTTGSTRSSTPQTFTTPPGQVGNVNATAGYASASVTWSAPTTGDPATAYKITPYIGSTAQSPDHSHREPGADLRPRVRPDQWRDLHVHSHRVQPGWHGTGIRTVQRGDTQYEALCPAASGRTEHRRVRRMRPTPPRSTWA